MPLLFSCFQLRIRLFNYSRILKVLPPPCSENESLNQALQGKSSFQKYLQNLHTKQEQSISPPTPPQNKKGQGGSYTCRLYASASISVQSMHTAFSSGYGVGGDDLELHIEASSSTWKGRERKSKLTKS